MITIRPGPVAATNDPLQAAIDILVERHLKGRTDQPSTEQLSSAALDISALVPDSFISGTVFGATATQVFEAPLAEMVKCYREHDFVKQLSDLVPTIAKVTPLRQLPEGGVARLVIAVPVLPNIPANIANIPVDDELDWESGPERATLTWHQYDDDGPMASNRGIIIMEPLDRARTRATVYAFHRLKDTEALTWRVQRWRARTFSIEHYSGFVIALGTAYRNCGTAP